MQTRHCLFGCLRQSVRAASACLLTLTWVTFAAAVDTDVATSRNDSNRTGANLKETVLTTSNVNSRQFGWLFSYAVDGNIFAQPLVVTDVTTSIGTRDLVIVATTNNAIYAFDANSATVSGGLIWTRRFDNPRISIPALSRLVGISYGGLTIPVRQRLSTQVTSIPYDDPTHYSPPGPNDPIGGTTFEGNIGILGTPVIDSARGTLFLVSRTKENEQYLQTLHALDIATGREKPNSPVVIARSSSPVSFAAIGNQRAGLALAHNRVVIAWGSPGGKEGQRISVSGQSATYHGYVLAYDEDSLVETGCFTTASEEFSGIGIWQSGRAPAIDDQGFIYYFTGNGWHLRPSASNRCNSSEPTAFPPAQNLANSLIKLDVRNRLKLVDSWTDSESGRLDDCDMDLGGSGPLLVPGTPLIVGGGKRGFLHVLDKNPAGHYVWAQTIQVYSGSPEGTVHGEGACLAQGQHHIMGGPVYWNGSVNGPVVYVSLEDERIKAYKLNKELRALQTAPFTSSTRKILKHPGAILSLSANGNLRGTGILWAVHADRTERSLENPFRDKVKGVLRAYDADDLSRELWNSNMIQRDILGDFAKFTPVTIANGKVYAPTFSGKLVVYGLHAQ